MEAFQNLLKVCSEPQRTYYPIQASGFYPGNWPSVPYKLPEDKGYYNETCSICPKCSKDMRRSSVYRGTSGIGGYWCPNCNYNHEHYGPDWMNHMPKASG